MRRTERQKKRKHNWMSRLNPISKSLLMIISLMVVSVFSVKGLFAQDVSAGRDELIQRAPVLGNELSDYEGWMQRAEVSGQITSGREAIFKSIILPGWGHQAVNPNDWRRGQVHMAADVVMSVGLVRSFLQEQRFMNDYETLARLKAGVTLSGKPRSFALALADYNSLQEYNAQMLRSRQWNRLIEETPENQWMWLTEQDRDAYGELRSDADRAGRQIPALISLMVTNRIISAFSAYNRARKAREEMAEIRLDPVWGHSSTSSQSLPSMQGVQATLRIRL